MNPEIEDRAPNPLKGLAGRWVAYWAEVRNAQWLAARDLCQLTPRLVNLFGAHIGYDAEQPAGDRWWLDWEAAAVHVESAGLSSTEYRLARLVLALTLPDVAVTVSMLAGMGSWQRDVWRVLVEWATDGTCTVVPTASVVELPGGRA